MEAEPCGARGQGGGSPPPRGCLARISGPAREGGGSQSRVSGTETWPAVESSCSPSGTVTETAGLGKLVAGGRKNVAVPVEPAVPLAGLGDASVADADGDGGFVRLVVEDHDSEGAAHAGRGVPYECLGGYRGDRMQRCMIGAAFVGFARRLRGSDPCQLAQANRQTRRSGCGGGGPAGARPGGGFGGGFFVKGVSL